ncbi:MAG: DEAD/DEAH box helicase [Myxococcaceae bacterium]
MLSFSDTSEIAALLKADLGRRLGRQSVDAWVSHLLSITPDDVEVRRGAAQALLRRVAASRSLEGAFRKTAPGRFSFESELGASYVLSLYASSLIEMSCTCPDFSRNALGICKHLWRLLETVDAKERGVAAPPDLVWMPIRAWHGAASLPEAFRWRQTVGSRVPAGWRSSEEEGYLRLESDGNLATTQERLRAALKKAEQVDPLAEQLIAEREPLAASFTRNTDGKLESARLGHLRRQLFPYQREGVQRLLSQELLLLGDDMGLGKTIQAISAASILLCEKKVQRCLVVCPASLKSQWAREWLETTGEVAVVVEGNPEERRHTYAETTAGPLLMNYEQVVRDFSAVMHWNADLVILDEAQRLKNWATKTALTIKALKPRYRWVLTGTPFENRLDELASLIEWIDDRALEPKWRLSTFHSVRKDGHRQVVAARHLDTLRARLSHCFLRRIKDDVLQQLPERTDTRISVPLTEEQREAHDGLNRPIAQLVRRRHRRPLTQAEFLKLMSLFNEQRMTSNALILPAHTEYWPELSRESPAKHLKLLGSPKLEEFRELVSQLVLAQGQKVAVFSQWRRMLEWAAWSVRDLLHEEGVDALFFTGQESQRRRAENLVLFHDDPASRLLFLSDAGGVGLNLQRAASVMVNLEYPWNPAVLEQRIARVHRHGQSRPVQVYLFGAEEGIEARIAALVGDKRAFFKGLFDGESDTVQFDQSGSFMESVEKLAMASDDSDEAAELEATLDGLDDGDTLNAFESGAPSEESPPERDLSAEEDATLELVPPAKAMPAPTLAGDWLRQIRVERDASGGLKIEADGDAADQLASVFSGLANLFASTAQARRPTGSRP